MNRDNYIWYQPSRGFRQTRPFLIVFGVLIIAGIPMIVSGLVGPGFAVIGLGLFFYALMLPQAAALGRKYGLGREGIFLKSMTKSRNIPFELIESAALLSRDKSRVFMEELYKSAVDAERNMDLGKWLKSNRSAAGVIRFLSVPVTGTEVRRGNSTNIIDYSVKPDAELLLLRLKSGEILLISPLDINKFYTAMIQKGITGRPFFPGEGIAIQSGNASSGRTRSLVRIISLTTSILTLLIVGYFVIYPAFRQKPLAETKLESEQEPELPNVPYTAWVDDDSYIFGVRKNVLPELERNGDITWALFKDYAAPRLLLLLEAGGEIPGGSSSREELKAYLGDFLVMHSRMTFIGEETADDGEIFNFFQVEQTEMRASVASLIRNF